MAAPCRLNIVLIEPEIPANNGAIGRLCLATQSTLHLVDPLGFEINDTQLKRAGLDYWQHVQVVRHANIEAFFKSMPENAPRAFFSTKGTSLHYDHRFQPESYLIFGKETAGLSSEILKNFHPRIYRIPQYDERVRSLNLANAVAVVVYEAIRQLGPGPPKQPA